VEALTYIVKLKFSFGITNKTSFRNNYIFTIPLKSKKRTEIFLKIKGNTFSTKARFSMEKNQREMKKRQIQNTTEIYPVIIF
jgi:hypothetical protein